MKRYGKLLALLLTLVLLISSMSAFASASDDPFDEGSDIPTSNPTQSSSEPTSQKPTQSSSEPASQDPTQSSSEPASQDPTQSSSEPASQDPSQSSSEPASQDPSQSSSEPVSQDPSQSSSEPTSQDPSQPSSEPTSQEPSQPSSEDPDEDDWEEDDFPWWDEGDDIYGDYTGTANADAYIVRSEVMRTTGTITGDVVNVREAPSTKAGFQQKAYKGAKVIITASVYATDGYYWYKVNFNGKTGYVRADFIARGTAAQETTEETDTSVTTLPDGTTGTITSGTVNVRKDASTSSTVVTKVNRGAELVVSGSVTGADGRIWYQVTANGKEGYVREDLITINETAVIDQETSDITGEEAVVPVEGLIPDADLLAVLAVDQAFLNYLDQLDDKAVLNNLDNLLTPMEILVFNSLSFKEQVLVVFAAIGYDAEVEAILTSTVPPIELSKHAASMVETISSRVEQLNEEDRAMFDTILGVSCPVYELEIDGEPREFNSLVITIGSGDSKTISNLGLYYDADAETWLIVPFVAAE